MTLRRYILAAASVLPALLAWNGASAQHTLGFIAGYGMANGRFQPQQEMRALWGMYSGGLTWRYYGRQRFVGGLRRGPRISAVGILLRDQLLAGRGEEGLPLLHAPCQYARDAGRLAAAFLLIRNHVRVYFEAAATFSYNLSSTYENEQAKRRGEADWRGDYRFKTPRDSRWGYGLAGGGGIAFLIRRYELNFRVRYYFGYSDIVRNRNRYADGGIDGPRIPSRRRRCGRRSTT